MSVKLEIHILTVKKGCANASLHLQSVIPSTLVATTILSNAEVANASHGISSATRIRIVTMDPMKMSVKLMEDVQKKHSSVTMAHVSREPVYAMAVGSVLMAATKQDATRESHVMRSHSSAKVANVCHSTHFVMQSRIALTDLTS